MTSNVNLDELSPLTPMVTPGGNSGRSIRSTGAGGSHWRNRLLIAGTALAFLSMAIWSQENATYRENVANQEDNHWLSMDRVSLWGSSKDKGHHHRHHVHQKPAKVSENLLQLKGYPPIDVQQQYLEDLAKIDFDKVKKDIALLLTESQDFWPADYGNYGGLFIRLSWHSCGSYRSSDGRGGCDGGGQRFDPERSWPDNTNLDKARRLLEPIKAKYGNGLSWGDLFALSGTVAIESMGGPKMDFCAGRLDFVSNEQTLALGPSPEQERFSHCDVDGECGYPLGQNTLGLIYVNPEGPLGEPDPQGAADTVRDVFSRMNWEGSELVALIGGGHTFGKAHGATTNSPGDPPKTCPFAPWAGATGMNAVTSGFEGPWTSHPTRWDNDYFKYLVDYEWESWEGPGGHHQWRVKGESPKARAADPASMALQDVMMLTTDIGLKVDPEYRVYVEEFAKNQTALDHAFSKAWYKLVTRDVGPASRCYGSTPSKKHHFQNPLPAPPKELANMGHVAKDLDKLMKKAGERDFLQLAWNCARTYRATDYQGGCNGASIRFPPAIDWPTNAGTRETLALLEPIKKKYGKGLSYADLIVLAGNVAAERSGAEPMEFCPGRTDAVDGRGWQHLEYGNAEYPDSVDKMIEAYERRGQTAQEYVALTLAHYGSVKNLQKMLESDELPDGPLGIFKEGLKYYPELRYWVDYYISSGDKAYFSDFSKAWTKLMNADRFDGPLGNVCDK